MLPNVNKQSHVTSRAIRPASIIEAAISGFNQAYQAKDFEALKKILSASPDMVWFGTDSAEVINGVAGWQAQTSADWQLFETIKMNEPRHQSIMIDSDARLASAIYEVPTDVVMGGKPMNLIFRFASTLRKENGEWRFVQGMIVKHVDRPIIC